jgi:hypothetical protein
MDNNLTPKEIKERNKKQGLGCLIAISIIVLLAVLIHAGALSENAAGFFLLFLFIAPVCVIIFIVQLIRKKDFFPWFAAAFFFLALGILGSWGVDKGKPTDRPLTDINQLESVKREKQEKESQLSAYVMAQDFVSSKLKAPATAKFPTFSNDFVTFLGDNRYRISAYVDAQNSYGATIRTHFSCVVKDVGNNKWVLESMEMH